MENVRKEINFWRFPHFYKLQCEKRLRRIHCVLKLIPNILFYFFRWGDFIICFRYHIKYMFVGDMLKDATEAIIRRLRPELQMRLRFISHLSVDEISASSGQKSM